MSITATASTGSPSAQPGWVGQRVAAGVVPFSKPEVAAVMSRFGIGMAASAPITTCTGATAAILAAHHQDPRAVPAQKGGTGR